MEQCEVDDVPQTVHRAGVVQAVNGSAANALPLNSSKRFPWGISVEVNTPRPERGETRRFNNIIDVYYVSPTSSVGAGKQCQELRNLQYSYSTVLIVPTKQQLSCNNS